MVKLEKRAKALYEQCPENNESRIKMAKTNPIDFIKQVRGEARKITWPTRQETTVSTIMVFIMVFISAVFLYFADQIIAWLIRLIMGFGL